MRFFLACGRVIAGLVLLGPLLGCMPDAKAPAPGTDSASSGTKTGSLNQGGVRLAQGAIEINGMSLNYPLQLGALEQAIGKASRNSKLVNIIYTWDEAGIYAYTKPGNDKINTLCFAFARSAEFAFVPKTIYPHSLQIGQHTLTKESGKRELQTAGFKSDPDFPDTFEIEVAGVSILAALDEASKTKLGSVDIELP